MSFIEIQNEEIYFNAPSPLPMEENPNQNNEEDLPPIIIVYSEEFDIPDSDPEPNF